MANDAVKAYAVFLASFGEEAERIRKENAEMKARL